mgnify:CR=1 FL=1
MASVESPGQRTTLFRHRDFRFLWMGDTVSVFGMQFVGFALPLVAIKVLHADELQMGILAALETLAFLLIGLPAGAWVDRWRKKRVIVLGDLSRATLLLTIPLAFLAGVLSMWMLYVVAFAVGCITVFFDVANQSYLPEIVEGEQISEGNSKLQASQQTAFVAGPAAASALVRLIGGPFTIAVTAACMALSSLFVSRIRHVEERPSAVDRPPLLVQIREGLSFVLGHDLLRRIVMCTGIGNFANSAASALYFLYALRVLGLTEVSLGVLMSVAGVGGLVGAVGADRFARTVGEGRAIPVAGLAIALTSFAWPLASMLPPLPVLFIGGFILSWAVVTYNVVQVSFRQRLCPKPLLGRMNASIRFLVWGPMPIGAFIGGFLGRELGILPTLWLMCGVALLASVPVVFSPLIRMRELPTHLDALSGSMEEESVDEARPERS